VCLRYAHAHPYGAHGDMGDRHDACRPDPSRDHVQVQRPPAFSAPARARPPGARGLARRTQRLRLAGFAVTRATAHGPRRRPPSEAGKTPRRAPRSREARAGARHGHAGTTRALARGGQLDPSPRRARANLASLAHRRRLPDSPSL
jgi:hypothetical protein